MALKECYECGREVSTRARECPNCGAPSPAASPPAPTPKSSMFCIILAYIGNILSSTGLLSMLGGFVKFAVKLILILFVIYLSATLFWEHIIISPAEWTSDRVGDFFGWVRSFWPW